MRHDFIDALREELLNNGTYGVELYNLLTTPLRVQCPVDDYGYASERFWRKDRIDSLIHPLMGCEAEWMNLDEISNWDMNPITEQIKKETECNALLDEFFNEFTTQEEDDGQQERTA